VPRLILFALLLLVPASACAQQPTVKCEEQLAAMVKMSGSFFHAAEMTSTLEREVQRLRAELATLKKAPPAPSTPPVPSAPKAPEAK
jgi:hypothetical protein